MRFQVFKRQFSITNLRLSQCHDEYETHCVVILTFTKPCRNGITVSYTYVLSHDVLSNMTLKSEIQIRLLVL